MGWKTGARAVVLVVVRAAEKRVRGGRAFSDPDDAYTKMLSRFIGLNRRMLRCAKPTAIQRPYVRRRIVKVQRTRAGGATPGRARHHAPSNWLVSASWRTQRPSSLTRRFGPHMSVAESGASRVGEELIFVPKCPHFLVGRGA